MSQRKAHLEFLRFLAILLVIFNHTGEAGYLYFTLKQESMLYPLYFLLSVLCKTAVPLFWMVSGALLLEKDEDLKFLFKHRILRIFAVLTVFSFLYYLYSAKGNPGFSLSIMWFLRSLYSSDMAPAFWFLYAYLGMLLLLPLLRRLVRAMTDREFMYIFSLVLVVRGLVPVLEYAVFHGETTLNPSLIANFFSYDVIFFISGYYLENRIEISSLKKKSVLILCVFALAAIVLMMGATQLRLNDGGLMTDAQGEMFYPGLLLLPGAAVFCCARLAFSLRENGKAAKASRLLGSVSFGVMLTEHLVRCETAFIYELFAAFLPPFIACILWVALIYLICGVFVYLIRKIPFVRKYI